MAGGQTAAVSAGINEVWYFLTGEVVATDVVDLGVLNEAPDLRLLQVVDIVVVGSAEVRAERAVVASDDDTTATSLVLSADAVLDPQARGLDGIVENGRVLVVAGTPEVHDAVRGEHVLRSASRVLGGAAGDELGVIVVEKIFVKGHLLLLGENGVVGLEVILG